MCIDTIYTIYPALLLKPVYCICIFAVFLCHTPGKAGVCSVFVQYTMVIHTGHNLVPQWGITITPQLYSTV